MHPLPSRKVDFMKKRDFSAIFSDGFKFFKSNFKVLIPAVLIIVGPLAVAVSGIQGYLHSQGVQAFSLFNLHRLLYYIVEDDTKYYLNLLQLVLTVIVSIVSMALLGRFFVLYQQSESIAIKDIFSHLVKDSVRVFLNYLFMMLFAILLGLIIFGFLQIPILNWILGIVGFIIFVPNLYFSISVSFYLVIRDKILFPAAFKKTLYYMRGNYWYTWATSVIAILIVGVMGMIFSIPYLILIIVDLFTKASRLSSEFGDAGGDSLIYIVLAIIAGLGSHLISPFYNIFNTLLYHSHEEESEGTGLKSKIDEIDLNS